MKRFSKWLTFGLALVLLLVPAIASAHGGNPGPDMPSGWRVSGAVTAMPTSGVVGEWTVDGVTFQVTANTEIDDINGAIAEGVLVHAEGTTENGQKIAIRVKSLGVCDGCNDGTGSWRLTGEVTSMPSGGLVGDWMIAGQEVVATETTHFQSESELKVGATVISAGVFDELGQRQANMIGILPPPHDSNAPVPPAWSLFGQIESRPADGLAGTWVISGQTVIATADTRFPQDSSGLVVGATVHASGDFDESGDAVATMVGLADRMQNGDGNDHHDGNNGGDNGGDSGGGHGGGNGGGGGHH